MLNFFSIHNFDRILSLTYIFHLNKDGEVLFVIQIFFGSSPEFANLGVGVVIKRGGWIFTKNVLSGGT